MQSLSNIWLTLCVVISFQCNVGYAMYDDRDTQFHDAASCGDVKTMSGLIKKYKKRSDFKFQIAQSLYVAASKGRLDLVKLLVGKKTLDDCSATSALVGAAENGKDTIVQFLLQNESVLKFIQEKFFACYENHNGSGDRCVACHLVLSAAQGGHRFVMRELIKNSTICNHLPSFTLSKALEYACKSGYMGIVFILTELVW